MTQALRIDRFFPLRIGFYLIESIVLAIESVYLVVRIFQGDNAFYMVLLCTFTAAGCFWTNSLYKQSKDLAKEPPSILGDWLFHLAIIFSALVCSVLFIPGDYFLGIPDAAIVALLVFNILIRFAVYLRRSGISV